MAADRTRPPLRPCGAGFLAPHDQPDRAHGADPVPRVHNRANVVELTGSRRALSRGGFFSGQSPGHDGTTHAAGLILAGDVERQSRDESDRIPECGTDGEGALCWGAVGAGLLMVILFATAVWS